MEPWRLPASGEGTAVWDQPGFALNNIAAGDFDAYIQAWAAGWRLQRGWSICGRCTR